MKKTPIILMILMVISSWAIAQDDINFSGTKKEKTDKSEKVKIAKDTIPKEKSIFVIPDASMYLDYHRGLVGAFGFRFVSGTKKIKSHYISLNFSLPFSSENSTALGLFYKTNPLKGKFGKNFSFGADVIYFYKCDLSAYTEWFFGGKLNNTFGPTTSAWETKRFVFAPRVDLEFPLNNSKTSKLGFSCNPLVIGYWDYDQASKSFSVCKRWYDISLMYQQSFPTKKLKAFKEKEK